jgi:hypothetical protein
MWVWMKKRLVIEREGTGVKQEFHVGSYVEMPDDVSNWVRSHKNSHEYVELRRDLEIKRIASEREKAEPLDQLCQVLS